MKVSEAIKALQGCNPDEEIMIQWYAKDHSEYMEDDETPVEVWNRAVELFEADPCDAESFGFVDCLDKAKDEVENG
jgi:hypothetical protein